MKVIREYIVTEAVKVNNIWTKRFKCPKCNFNYIKQEMKRCPACKRRLIWEEEMDNDY